MRVRLIGYLAACGFALAPAVGGATDWQHESPNRNENCNYCHSLFVGVPSNFNNACLGCHNQPAHKFGSPWTASDEAVPGVTGMSHNWSGAVESPGAGATAKWLPDSARAMLVNGNLQCTVCHNPHVSETAPAAESMHTSIPVGVPQPKTGTLGMPTGTGTLTLSVVPGTPAIGYRVKVQTVAAGGGSFIISHFPGAPDGTWMNWTGSAWEYVSSSGPGRPYSNGVDVPLDVGGVTIRLSAGAVVGDYWDFYVGYPFLRMTNVGDAVCFNCHQERVMNHVRARGLDRYYLPNGVRKFSHPVGIGLNANGFGTDRGTILDADGTAGSSATDGLGAVPNATNDLLLKGGVVGCTTCHAAHNADTNSLTVDAR